MTVPTVATSGPGVRASSRVFERLDILRGLAALIVVWSHVGSGTNLYQPAMAGVAVDLFFGMSGFVIASSYGHRLAAGLSFRRFFLIRLIRLYPMYATGVIVSICIMLLFPVGRDSRQAIIQLVMLPDPRSMSLYPLNGPAWSLMYELLINIVYSLTFRHWTIRNTAIAMTASALYLLYLSASGQSLDGGWNWSDGRVAAARIVYCFSAGVLIFQAYEEKLFEHRPWPLIVVSALGVVPALLPTFGSEIITRLPIVLFLVPLTIFAGVASSKMKPTLISNSLGRLSYPIYGLHYPLIFLANLTFPGLVAQPYLFASLFMLTLIFSSLLVEALVDRPLRGWLAKGVSHRVRR